MKFYTVPKMVLIGCYFLLGSILIAQDEVETKLMAEFESSNYLETSDYDETIKYFQTLAENSVRARLINMDTSPQGRDLMCLIVSENEKFTRLNEIKNSGKPIILIINGIHSGEIEGKDACMLMLREILITREKKSLIENAILLIIPIFNVDGHERKSSFNRINQNGPKEMGWRTTAQNLNLNRDFMKADSPEMKALLRLFNTVVPDFLIDTHTTNGADYQYNITYDVGQHQNTPERTVEWIKNDFVPYVTEAVEDDGFLISPYVSFVEKDVNKGMKSWVATPRFSTGYSSIQNRPSLLIETHMLKPYKDRVFSTKSLLEATISKINDDAEELLELNNIVDIEIIDKYAEQKKAYPVKFRRTEKFEEIIFKGIQYENFVSDITGVNVIKYTEKEIEYQIPFYNFHKPEKFVNPPLGYIIPKEWSELLAVLNVHGIDYEKLTESKRFVVEKIKFKNVTFAEEPYEGRFVPTFDFDKYIDTLKIETGDYFVPCSQRSIGVILHLMEPEADDSFVRWGFFNIIFERKEYYETYSFEPIAKKMLSEDSDLRREFEMRIAQDQEFKEDPAARLNFFYTRSIYYDKKHNWYPILRVIGE